MANKYCNLDGTKKIKDEFGKINVGFDKVEEDLGAQNDRVDTIITTPTTEISVQEIVDARQGKLSLGSNLTGIKTKAINYSSADEGLASLDYWSSQEVRVHKNNFTCKGFRFRGANYKRFGKSVDVDPSITYPKVNYRDIPICNGYTQNQWYAVFGVVKEGEEYGKFVSIPFLLVHSIVGNTVSFSQCGMSQTDINQIKDYGFKPIADHEVLLITLNSKYDGSLLKVVSNTSSTITLDKIPLNMKKGDWLLVAPQKDDYVYLGSFYVDTAEIFNRADDGSGTIKFRGVSIDPLVTGNIKGDISTGVDIDFSRYISPLATGVFFYVYDTYGTTATGDVGINFGMDIGHDIEFVQKAKWQAGATAMRFYCNIPFMQRQKTNIKSFGPISGSASDRVIQVRGYTEK